ncbi:uncharacterized protein [Musca autumnalis]|uniref:uncharacterized protein n=1 Tax=Musca autumnalis TaxID=221902 RepID=UPI003CEE73DB
MKFLIFVLFLSLLGIALGSQAAGFFADPEHPGKCVYKDLVLSPGEEGTPKGECSRFVCNMESGFAKFHGCGAQSVEPPCKLGDFIDAKAPYPKCCEKYVVC